MTDDVRFVGCRSKQNAVLTRDVCPCRRFAVGMRGSRKRRFDFASGSFDAETLRAVPQKDTVSRDADVASSHGRASQMIGVVGVENSLLFEPPQWMTVVGIDRDQFIQTFREQPTFVKQGRWSASVALRKIEVDVAKPHGRQRALD